MRVCLWGGPDALRPARIFRDLSDDALAQLAAKVRMRHFLVGDALMWQGEASDAMYVITEGRVRVERTDTGTDKPPAVPAELGAREVVGEMGVLDGAPRSATVVAESEVETMELDAVALSDAMRQHPQIAAALLHIVTKRMRSTDALLDHLAHGETPSSNGSGYRAPPDPIASSGSPHVRSG